MDHRSPVQPLKSFLPFHPMLPGMFFLPLSMRASSLTQGTARGNSPVGSTQSSTVNVGAASHGAPPTTPSKAKQETMQADPAEPGQ